MDLGTLDEVFRIHFQYNECEWKYGQYKYCVSSQYKKLFTNTFKQLQNFIFFSLLFHSLFFLLLFIYTLITIEWHSTCAKKTTLVLTIKSNDDSICVACAFLFVAVTFVCGKSVNFCESSEYFWIYWAQNSIEFLRIHAKKYIL